MCNEHDEFLGDTSQVLNYVYIYSFMKQEY